MYPHMVNVVHKSCINYFLLISRDYNGMIINMWTLTLILLGQIKYILFETMH